MIQQPWWERWPERLEQELRELCEAGADVFVDEASKAAGVLRLDLRYPFQGEKIRLQVVFPEAYPYFRFEVIAPDLELSHHQNPFERNLCLLGRRTFEWDTSNTAALLLTEQFPRVIAAAGTDDVAALKGVEQQQAEPFSEYYPVAPPSTILVQSDWMIDPKIGSGFFTIGTFGSDQLRPDKFIRGAVVEIAAENGARLFRADDSLRSALTGRAVAGRWARMPYPIRRNEPGPYLDELFHVHPHVVNAKENHVEDGWLRVWGILFPEEVAHRQLGDGWAFVCGWAKCKSPVAAPAKPRRPDRGRKRK